MLRMHPIFRVGRLWGASEPLRVIEVFRNGHVWFLLAGGISWQAYKYTTELADFAVSDQFHRSPELRPLPIGTLLASYLKTTTLRAHHVTDDTSFGQGHGQRLLHIDMLPREGRSYNRLGMPMVRRANGYRIDSKVLKQLAVVVIFLNRFASAEFRFIRIIFLDAFLSQARAVG